MKVVCTLCKKLMRDIPEFEEGISNSYCQECISDEYQKIQDTEQQLREEEECQASKLNVSTDDS